MSGWVESCERQISGIAGVPGGRPPTATATGRRLAGKKVEVVNYPDGRFAAQFNGTALDFRVFD
jgi:hypothetical protein